MGSARRCSGLVANTCGGAGAVNQVNVLHTAAGLHHTHSTIAHTSRSLRATSGYCLVSLRRLRLSIVVHADNVDMAIF